MTASKPEDHRRSIIATITAAVHHLLALDTEGTVPQAEQDIVPLHRLDGALHHRDVDLRLRGVMEGDRDREIAI